jgi:hypothetical protein
MPGEVQQLDFVSSKVGWALRPCCQDTQYDRTQLLKTIDGGHWWTVVLP